MEDKFASKLLAGPVLVIVFTYVSILFSTTFSVVPVQIIAWIITVFGVMLTIDGITIFLEKLEKVLDIKIKDAERREWKNFE